MSMNNLKTFAIIINPSEAPLRIGFVAASFPDLALSWLLVAFVLLGMNKEQSA